MKEEGNNSIYIAINPERFLAGDIDVQALFGLGAFINLPNKGTEYFDNHKDGKQHCQLCPYSTHTYRYLKKHMARVHEHNVRCDQCDFQCGEKSYLDGHIRAVHSGEKLQCPACPKQFVWKTDLFQHKQALHSGLNMTCFVCKKSFQSKANLKRHLNTGKCRSKVPEDFTKEDFRKYVNNKKGTISKKSAEQYFCEYCNKSYRHEQDLKEHLVIHSDWRKFCDFCEETFDSLDLFKGHNCAHNETSQESIMADSTNNTKFIKDPLVCSYCGHETYDNKWLKIHISKEHETESLLKCEECEYKASESYILKKHVEKQHTHIEIICEFCSELFTSKKEYGKHRVTHSRVRTFKSMYKEDSNIKCDICKWASFTTYMALKRHKQTVHEGIRYSCTHCKKSYTQQSTLAAHIKLKHSSYL